MEKAEKEGLNGDFILFVLERWKKIAIITLIVLAGTAVATFFQHKMYASGGTIFPSENNLVESVVDNPNVGYDLEADRLLSLLQSSDVFDSVVNKFNLVDYYHYDKSKASWRDDLKKDYAHDVKMERTPYMSIVITVQSKDPEMSANIVNYIISLADEERNRLYRGNLTTAFNVLGKEYERKKAVVDSMENEIARLRKVTPIELLVMPNSDHVIEAKSDTQHAVATTKLERLINDYTYEQFRLNDLATRYEKAKTQCERPLTQVYVVDKAKPSYKKVSPSLVTNLLVAGIGTVIFCIFYLLIIERIRHISMKR